MILRLALAAGVLLVLVVGLALWRRPPRRLGRLELGELGVLGPAIVQFTTRTCAPCKAAIPRLEAAAQDTEVPFVQIDVGDRPEVARRYGIRTVPTIAVTGRGGRVMEVWTRLPHDGQVAETARRAVAS